MWRIWQKNTPRKRIYLDYASATPVLPLALRTMIDAQHTYANPGSIHREGVLAAQQLQTARERIAHEIGCKAREIIFTSGGTESNNLAILGYARAIERGVVQRSVLGSYQGPTSVPALSNTHWVVSAIEHPSVLACFAEIERLGGRVDFVDPDTQGIIQPEKVAYVLRPETVFVSIGWGNGEIGVIQPLARIARILRTHEQTHSSTIVFHSDAGQSPLYEAAHVHSLGVDMLTLDSGKLYGPRGVAALYLNDRVHLVPLQLGGGQERGLRAGTEHVALALGFAEAFASIARERDHESKRLRALRDAFIKDIHTSLPNAVVNGDTTRSLPHIINISLPATTSEYLTLALDYRGIAIATKSACREGDEQQSHVVAALHGDEWRSKNTLRFSIGRDTTHDDLVRTVETLVELVALHSRE